MLTNDKKKSQRGQAMLIAVLTIGGAILGATTLAGILMVYQIRATTDSANSAKAIFAADSGIDWALYSYYHPPQGPPPALANGGGVTVTCYDATNAATVCDNSNPVSTTSYAISQGLSVNASRAFLVSLSASTATVP